MVTLYHGFAAVLQKNMVGWDQENYLRVILWLWKFYLTLSSGKVAIGLV